MQIIKYNS